MSEASPLYPLKFEPIYLPKVWGGRSLERLGRRLPGDAGERIGESWELADLGETSPSGAGGRPARSIVRNGSLRGRSLHDLVEHYGQALLGRLTLSPSGEFPLLVKFLDARENLSVQVHPSPAYAQAHPQAHLKSEAWYVLHAEPGGCIYKGLNDGVDPADLEAAVRRGDSAEVAALLRRVPVKAGDCHYLPSGTVHALGAGVLVAEVQTPSDTTYRLFDWGRQGRALHLEQAMQCVGTAPPLTRHHERRSHVAGMFTTVTRLVLCDHFRLEKVRMVETYEQELPYDQPAVWIVLEGRGVIRTHERAKEGEDGWVGFEAGEVLLVPAGLDDAKVRLEADTVWLEVTFPKALAEPIA